MGNSSIHISPVSGGSESHNQRLKDMAHVRQDLKHLNSSFVHKSISEAQKEISENYKSKIGQKMQSKMTPIREGVLLISESHNAKDIQRLADRLEKEFGIKTIQGYCHHDEGHYNKDTGTWKTNHHAHMVFDWTNHETGKSIKLDKDAMSKIQDIVSDELGLERGASSNKKHLNSIQYRNQKEKEELEYRLGKKEASKTLEELKGETSLREANLKYVVEKTQVEQEKLNDIKSQQGKSFNRGF